MAANFGLVAHATEGHAHELAIRGAGDGLAKRGLADAGRPDQAQDRSLQLVDALLHGEVFDDALLDLFQAVMVGIEHVHRGFQALRDLGLLAPRQVDQGLDVSSHHGGLGRHGRHHLQLLQLGLGLLGGLLRHVRGLDALVQLIDIAGLVDIAEFFLDRLDLLVQVVLALTLLHLALDAAADALFHLQDVDFGFHETHQMVEPGLQVGHFQDRLLLFQLQRQMRGNGVGQAPGVVDAGQRGEDFRRNLLVEFDVIVELRQQRAPHRLDFRIFVAGFRQLLATRHEVAVGLDEFLHRDAQVALDQHFHGAIRQLEHLQDAGNSADFVQVVETGFVLGRRLLRHQQDVLAALHCDFERLDRLGTAHEQRDHHVRKHHYVAQRQQRQGNGICELGDLAHDFLGSVAAYAV